MHRDFDAVVNMPPGRARLVKSGLASRCRVAAAALEAGRTVVFLAHSREEYQQARGLLSLFLPDLSAQPRPVETPRWQDALLALPSGADTAKSGAAEGGAGAVRGHWNWLERLPALYALRAARARCLLVTPQSLLLRYMPLQFFEEHEAELTVGAELDVDSLLEQAVLWGFERVPTVTRPGDVARRGDIFDIWSPGYDRPARLEFFGDTLEEIRFFDAAGQRSLCTARQVTLLPVLPVSLAPRWREKAEKRWERLFQKGLLGENALYDMRQALGRGGAGLLPGVYYDAPTTLEEWLPHDVLWLLPGEADTRENTASASWAL
ncbi:MAG: hypothetical protein IKH84_00135, partial [Ottowia sp.]|nr:hypothetical protein [Ottowia sp.]